MPDDGDQPPHSAHQPSRPAERSDALERTVAMLRKRRDGAPDGAWTTYPMCVLGRTLSRAVEDARHHQGGRDATVAWFGGDAALVAVDASRLRPVLARAIGWALESADPQHAVVDVTCEESGRFVRLQIRHNGAAWHDDDAEAGRSGLERRLTGADGPLAELVGAQWGGPALSALIVTLPRVGAGARAR